jgi:hypothetical protein
MTLQHFDTPGTVTVRVKNRAGEIRFVTHDQPTTEVEVTALDPAAEEVVAQTTIDCRPADSGHTVEVDVPSEGATISGGFLRRVMSLAGEGVQVRVVVRCPIGTNADITSASADVTGTGTLGAVKAKTASGDLTFDRIEAAAQINSASGDVTFAVIGGAAKIESVSGDVRGEQIAGVGKVQTASGDVLIEFVTDRLVAETVSGDVRVGEAGADCQVKTTSGDISLGKASTGRVDLQAVSGDLRVGVAAGSLLHVEGESLSGDLRSEIALLDDPPGDGETSGPTLQVNVKTISGDAVIRRA